MVPGQAPLLLEMAHRARYLFAGEICRGKKVLDFGCGAGYGSQMLSKVADTVLGVDISREAVEFAQNHYRAQNLKYLVGEIDALVSGPDRFDTVVCFEVIEHLEEPQKFLKKLALTMTGSGQLIISTPNGKDEKNPYHHHGWDADEFAGLLSADFRDIKLFGQGSSQEIEIFRESERQALQMAESRAAELKSKNPLAVLLPRWIKRLIYAWMVGRKLPKEKQWTADDFPIGENQKDGEIIIAVCQKK